MYMYMYKELLTKLAWLVVHSPEEGQGDLMTAVLIRPATEQLLQKTNHQLVKVQVT